MTTQQIQRPQRERGTYIPASEVEAYLANGWEIMDIPPGCDDVLMRAPAALLEIAA